MQPADLTPKENLFTVLIFLCGHVNFNFKNKQIKLKYVGKQLRVTLLINNIYSGCVPLSFVPTLDKFSSPPRVSSILSTLVTTAGYSTHANLFDRRATVEELPGTSSD